jgi:hypothetical protein
MSGIILLGVPRTILLGGAIAALVTVTALTLKITQPKVTLPRAAVAAPAGPIHPAPLSTPWQFNKPWQDLREEIALP